jgi:Flp pilus assembly protein TadD
MWSDDINEQLWRISDLMDEGSYQDAASHLRPLLAAHPDDARPWMLLAAVRAELGNLGSAVTAAEKAVALTPDNAYAHWLLGSLLFTNKQYKRALEEAEASLRLDYDSADSYVLKGRALAALGRREEAIKPLEGALVVDPEHDGARRLRALFLEQTGRTEEARGEFMAALERDADDAFAHTGRGWIGLRTGETNTAAHFRNALRIDPDSEWAKEGLIQSLKARNPVFRLMLRYFLWMETQTAARQRLFIFGGIIGYTVLRRLAIAQPGLAPLIWPLLGLYIAFVLLSWLADPLFDTLLRFDAEGRTALSADRISASNWLMAALVVIAITLVGAALQLHENLPVMALIFGLMLLPLAATFQCYPGWPRAVMGLLTVTIAALGVGLLFVARDLEGTMIVAAIFLAVGSTWLGRGLASVDPSRDR